MTINKKYKMRDTIEDTIQVGVANAGAIGISLAEVNEVLTTVSLLVAISFSIYKFLKTKK
jgi:EamA domain-containing membrane protein RarD|tara:strand:+ start:345 stop:524 length:180 start_codon:yes stop_codon:yes gene_type:complete